MFQRIRYITMLLCHETTLNWPIPTHDTLLVAIVWEDVSCNEQLLYFELEEISIIRAARKRHFRTLNHLCLMLAGNEMKYKQDHERLKFEFHACVLRLWRSTITFVKTFSEMSLTLNVDTLKMLLKTKCFVKFLLIETFVCTWLYTWFKVWFIHDHYNIECRDNVS